MKPLFTLCLLCFSLLLFGQTKTHFSSMDVFELEWVSNPQISPNGQKIVYLRRGMDIMEDKRISRLWIIDANGQNNQKLTDFDTNESNPIWSPDGDKIAFTTTHESRGKEIFIYDLKTQKTTAISDLPQSPSRLTWSPDGQWIAFAMFVAGSEMTLGKGLKKPKGAKWAGMPRITTRFKHEADGSGYMKPGFTHYFVIPAEGGMERQVTSGNFQHKNQPVWTKDSKYLLFSSNRNTDWEYDFRNSELYKVDLANGKVTAITDRKGPDRTPTISPDGQTIAYLGYDDKVQTYQITRLFTMNLDGSNRKQIPLDLDRSVSSFNWDKSGKGLYFQYDDKGNTKIGYTNLKGKTRKIADNVGGTSIGRPYSGGSYSINSNEQIAFTYCTPYHPADIGFLAKGGTMKRLTQVNSDLLEYRTLGKVEEIWYKSSIDQRDIQGWVVYPPDFDASKQYPLLVENHGGPIANYGDRFSPEMQLYATAGYVVFYPNARGSTSYGEEFGNLLYNNYPGEDYNDVMDGVDELLKQPYLTEDNLFVTGGSAGGIMTAWIIGKNNRFRSAAVIKPIMNWMSKTLVADNYYGYANSRYPGQPWENPDTYLKFSPISLVGNVQTPTLVMVGMNDLRTPPAEAKMLYHALKLRKIETALVEIPGAYHFIANRPSHLITKIEYILAWFDKFKKE